MNERSHEMSGNVVLVHGLGGGPSTWSRVTDLLEGLVVFAPQLTGATSIEDDALDVARQMRAAGMAQATVVGHSRGGLVATALAEQYPSMVERLVLVATPPTTASRLTARSASERLLRVPVVGPLAWTLLPASGLRRGLGTAFAPSATVPDFAVDDLRTTGRSRLVANGDATDHYLSVADLSARLATLHCDVDVVYGLDDRRVDATAMAHSAGDRRAHPLAHEGHGAPWTSAGAVAAVIRGTARPRHAITPEPPSPAPRLKPRRWRPPVAPVRARRPESEWPMGDVQRVELPGRGPEDVRIDSRGRILTGIEDGRILRITLRGDATPIVETVADTGGRPLGIAVVDDSSLLVCDSERGLLKVDADTGDVDVLVAEVDGTPLNFASNVVRAQSGRVYFTASTRRFGIHDYLADLLEHSGTGRLLVLETDGTVRTLIDGIQFANGLVVSDDENRILVSETGSFRLARYRRSGEKFVPDNDLVSNLPGFPDNLSVDDDDLVWISIANPRVALFDAVARLPGFVRRLAYSLPEGVRSGSTTTWVMAVDGNGDVVYDLQTGNPEYSTVTSVVRLGDRLVLGSITESALGIVDVPGLGLPGTDADLEAMWEGS